MGGTGEYQRDRWQIVVDPLGYPSIHETDEDGRPGDLVAHCFADRENLIAAAPDLLEALQRLVHDVDDLIGNSEGVYGLHQNGDPSPWLELAEGGRFEAWLGEALYDARAAIAKALGQEGGAL